MSVQNWQVHNSSTLKLYVPSAHVATLLWTANILQIVYAVGGSPRKFRYFKKFDADALAMTYDQYHYSSVEASNQTFSIGTSEANKTWVGREGDAYSIYMWYENNFLYLNTTAPGGHASSQFGGNTESGTTGNYLLAEYSVTDPGVNCSLSSTTITQYTAVTPTISNPKQFMMTNRESFMDGTYTQSTGYLSPVTDYSGAPFSGWGIEPCWAKHLRKLSVNGIAVWEFTAPYSGEFQFTIGQSTLNYSSVYGAALSSPPTSGYTTQSTGNNASILIAPQSMSAGNVIYFTFATSFWGYDNGSTGGAGYVAAWYTAPPASTSSVADITVRGMDASHNTLVTDTESASMESSKWYRVNVAANGVDHWGWSIDGGSETMMPPGSTNFLVNGADYQLSNLNRTTSVWQGSPDSPASALHIGPSITVNGGSLAYGNGTLFAGTALQYYDDYPGTQGGHFSLATNGTFTFTFSQPVTNPRLGIWSLGNGAAGVTSTVTFSEECRDVEPSTPVDTNAGFGIQKLNVGPYQVSVDGLEGYGILQFDGTHTSITMTMTNAENYSQYSWALAPY